jgi:uncharacterized protein (TIGR00297 family)
MQLVAGGLLGILVAYVAWRANSLTNNGAVAAAILGSVIFGFGGLSWAVLLLTFFISSSLLSHAFRRRKLDLDEKFQKGGQRDWGQVVANGGLALVLVLVQVGWPSATWVWWTYAGALAAVNADTWATELGVLNRARPRLITTWRKVERGTSGAISLRGTLAAAGGAALIGLVAALFPVAPFNRWMMIAGITVAGLAGSLVDSFLGATVQVLYYCPTCQKETERYPQHLCGTSTSYLRGWRWLNNDWVNWICSLAGALAALGAWLLIGINQG